MLTVVISQAQGRNPTRRQLEEDIASGLLHETGVSVTLVPHLYNMPQNHSGLQFLREVPGDIVVFSWLYERAIRWTLDRAGVRGQVAQTLLQAEDETDDDDDDLDDADENSDRSTAAGIGSVEVPSRNIWCIDLRVPKSAAECLTEIQRIRSEQADRQREAVTAAALAGTSSDEAGLMAWIRGAPSADQLQRYLQPERLLQARRAFDAGTATLEDKVLLPEDTGRRWYPVIDYSRCTNCMECIDFCLFGVYGVDALDRILVEQQDSCKKGCPACSRVCPANAIIFPHHKTAAIAGAEGEVSGLKIDLSKLFGGDSGESALEMAVLERDRELILDGRHAVGMSVGIRQKHREEMDQLVADLETLDF
jgi:NAD-dependent dihydropyrimidine dehydrogenase PreA subunit